MNDGPYRRAAQMRPPPPERTADFIKASVDASIDLIRAANQLRREAHARRALQRRKVRAQRAADLAIAELRGFIRGWIAAGSRPRLTGELAPRPEPPSPLTASTWVSL